jgi:hypothetical protein
MTDVSTVDDLPISGEVTVQPEAYILETVKVLESKNVLEEDTATQYYLRGIRDTLRAICNVCNYSSLTNRIADLLGYQQLEINEAVNAEDEDLGDAPSSFCFDDEDKDEDDEDDEDW